MATYVDRGQATYGGLLQQTYAAIIVGSICITLVETLRRVPRRRGRGEVARADPIPDGETTGLTEEEVARIRGLGSRENWTNGYLYMARCWAAVPSPLHPKWPLMWIWQVLRTNDETFLRLSGVDATVYTRFLRACFYFAALHTCTTLVVLLPIHYVLAPPEIKKSDINRGSVTTLVRGLPEERADKILWVHMVMVIWITVSWMLLLTWFVLGSLRYRAYAACHVPAPAMSNAGSPQQPASPTTRNSGSPPGNMSSFPAGAYTSGTPLGPLHPEPAPIRSHSTDDRVPDYSLRCRTVMITNIPQNLRSPDMLRWYFGRYLPDGPAPENTTNGQDGKTKPWQRLKSAIEPRKAVAPPVEQARPRPSGKSDKRKIAHDRGNILDPFRELMTQELEMSRDEIAEVEARGRTLVENVVLAPKLSTLAKLIAEREQRMEELEEAHILLAKAVMDAVGKEMDKRRRAESRGARQGEIRRRQMLRTEARSHQGHSKTLSGENGGGWLGAARDAIANLVLAIESLVWGEPDRSEGMDKLVQVIGPFVEEARRRDAEYGVVPWARGVVAQVRLKIQGKQSRTKGSEAGGKNPEESKKTQANGHAPHSRAESHPTSKQPASPTSLGNGSSSSTNGKSPISPTPTYDTVWSALYDLEPDYLLPYRPFSRKRSIFWYPLELIGILTPTGLPSIDLAFRRVQSLQNRIEEYKTRPLPDAAEKKRDKGDNFFIDRTDEDNISNGHAQPHANPAHTVRTIEAASSAFVTFRRWEDARRAARALAHRPGRPLTCLVVMAPQTTDLDWERLVKGKFAAQFVRDWFVGVAIWFFQIFWIFPISFITTLISIKSLEIVFRPLARFFDNNPKARSLITGLIPTLLVAGLGLLIPVILFVIGRKAQTEVTFSGLHNGILIRYYKWLILNIVIFFCIGITGFQTFLEGFRKQIPNPFQLVSSSFPAAAPFYAGWFILQTSLQNLMQFGLVGLPLITYVFGVRKASTPRKRKRGTQPRTIDYHYWTPNHLLAMHILMIFAVMNPLVIPFGLIYYSVANVVFRNQLLRVYARRFYEGNGKMLTIRVLRYSMDGLALSHIVFLAFNLLNYNRARAGISGTLFGVTLILKTIATREFRARYERLEDAESARLCGNEEPFMTSQERISHQGTRKSTGVVTSDAPLPPERLNSFQSPADAMGPSTISWNLPALKNLGHKYNVGHIRNHPLRGRHKPKSMSLSRITSRTGSLVEIMRPDSPTSVETTAASPVHPSSRLTANPLGIVQQVPNMILGFVTANPSEDTALGGANHLGGNEPTNVVLPGPKPQRWDDTPNGSASYECPYYLDEGPEWIWLPRDPSGPVDLDDTVAMYRLLLSVHDHDMPNNEDTKASVNNQDRKVDNTTTQSPQASINRPPIREHDNEKSLGIPFTQSPMGTPDEGPAQATSYSARASRPSMLHVRTTSADQHSFGSLRSRRRSVSDAMEMRNLQVPPVSQTAATLEPIPGETSAQPRIHRQPSLLSAFRTQRSGERSDAAGRASVISYKMTADGGEGRQNLDRRKSRALPPEDVRRALDATVLAEEELEKARKAKEEQTEKIDDARVEQGETGGWSLLKKLMLKKNTDK